MKRFDYQPTLAADTNADLMRRFYDEKRPPSTSWLGGSGRVLFAKRSSNCLCDTLAGGKWLKTWCSNRC